MRIASSLSGTAVLLVFSAFILVTPVTADEATLRSQLEFLELTPEGAPEEKVLLEIVGTLMRDLQAKPTSEEFRRRMARGRAANDAKAFGLAVDEFQAAVEAAPWRADAHYSLGFVADRAGQFDRAMLALRVYLAAAPDADNAAEVQALIYEIEFRKEHAGQTGAAAAAKAAKEQERQRQQETEARANEERRRQEQRANEERRRIERRVASFLGQWNLRCPQTHGTTIRLTPAGQLAVNIQFWLQGLNPAKWSGAYNLKFDLSANKFVSQHGTNDPIELAVIDDNRLRYSRTHAAGTTSAATKTCTAYRK